MVASLVLEELRPLAQQSVLLVPPMAHLVQKLRGCPRIDVVPGCQRESS